MYLHVNFQWGCASSAGDIVGGGSLVIIYGVKIVIINKNHFVNTGKTFNVIITVSLSLILKSVMR